MKTLKNPHKLQFTNNGQRLGYFGKRLKKQTVRRGLSDNNDNAMTVARILLWALKRDLTHIYRATMQNEKNTTKNATQHKEINSDTYLVSLHSL